MKTPELGQVILLKNPADKNPIRAVYFGKQYHWCWDIRNVFDLKQKKMRQLKSFKILKIFKKNVLTGL